jgi:8-oxo-dGTP pyrophosphatase MutT (NUDIX family)
MDPNAPDWMMPQGRPWTAHAERLVYENPWIRVSEFQAEAPTGHRTVYGVVRYANLAIGILPLHEDGTVTLVGQHRFPRQDYTWELPEGGAPVGSDPLEGARRELREETGLEARDWRQVLLGQLSNSVSDELCVGFIATGLSQSEAEPDETEALALARVPFAEALEQALCGNIQDIMTVAILLRAYHMAREGALPEPLAKAMLDKAGDTP